MRWWPAIPQLILAISLATPPVLPFAVRTVEEATVGANSSDAPRNGADISSGTFRLDTEKVGEFAKEAWRVSDTLGDIGINSVLWRGAGACPGTQLVDGLYAHADEQHEQVTKLSESWNNFGTKVRGDVETFQAMEARSASRIENQF